jgi:hypothetical protein
LDDFSTTTSIGTVGFGTIVVSTIADRVVIVAHPKDSDCVQDLLRGKITSSVDIWVFWFVHSQFSAVGRVGHTVRSGIIRVREQSYSCWLIPVIANARLQIREYSSLIYRHHSAHTS